MEQRRDVHARCCRFQEIVDLTAGNVVIASQGVKRAQQWQLLLLGELNAATQVDVEEKFELVLLASPACFAASLPLCLSACLPVRLSACPPVRQCASLPRCLAASLPHCLAASLPRCLAASLPRCLAASLPRCLAASLPRCPLPRCHHSCECAACKQCVWLPCRSATGILSASYCACSRSAS
jgi:hypothetical protein